MDVQDAVAIVGRDAIGIGVVGEADHPPELAAKALSIMESFSITSLVVTGDKDKAVGIIHLHDILKKGIV